MYAWKVESQFRWQSLVWFMFWVVELLLITRFVLKLFMPYSDSVLGSAVYRITEYLLVPLTAVFGAIPTSGPVFEWVTLFSILLYWLLVEGVLTWFVTSRGMSRIEMARMYSQKKYGHWH